MADYVRAFLTGVAIGGVSSVMFEANKFVLKRLWGVNCIAAKLAWEMIKGVAPWRQERADDEGNLMWFKVNIKVDETESETESEVIESES